jgi:hypothetical protein
VELLELGDHVRRYLIEADRVVREQLRWLRPERDEQCVHELLQALDDLEVDRRRLGWRWRGLVQPWVMIPVQIIQFTTGWSQVQFLLQQSPR